MKGFKKISLIGMLIWLTACAGISKKNDLKALDEAVAYLEKFGSITMSAPILAKPGSVFKFDPGQNVSTELHYNNAKSQLQGKASLLEKFSMALGASSSAQMDPVQLALYEDALKKYREISQQNDAIADQRDALETKIRDIANSEFAFELSEAEKLPVAERIKAMDAAIAKYRERMVLAGVTANPYPGLNNTGNVPSVNSPAHANSAAAGLGTFTERDKLLPEAALTVSDRVALKIAQGDSAMQAIFSVLGNAAELSAYEKTYYGVSLVTVTPGWHTHQGYSANLTLIPEVIYEEDARADVRKKYIEANPGSCVALLLEGNVNEKAWKTVEEIIQNNSSRLKAGEKDVCEGFSIKDYSSDIQPASVKITAISPLSNSQNLNLSSSQRDKIEYSLALALALREAGQEVQAKTFLDYAQSLEADFQTVTEENSVNIASGEQIDIQVGPVSTALTGSQKNKPANKVLERQTFPVLLLLGFEYESNPSGAQLSVSPQIVEEEGKNIMVLKSPRIQFTQVQGWVRNEDLWRFWPKSWWPHMEADELSSRIGYAEKLEAVSKTGNALHKAAAGALLNRLGMGSKQIVLIPKDTFVYESENLVGAPAPKLIPAIDKIYPESVVLKESDLQKGKQVIFTLIGSKLNQATVKANIDPSAKPSAHAVATDTMVTKEITVKNANTPVIFSVSTPGGITHTASMPIPVTVMDKKPEANKAGNQ